jgi:hypothetical protein
LIRWAGCVDNLNAPTPLVQRWFADLDAPIKAIVIVEHARRGAFYIHREQLERFLTERVRPLAIEKHALDLPCKFEVVPESSLACLRRSTSESDTFSNTIGEPGRDVGVCAPVPAAARRHRDDPEAAQAGVAGHVQGRTMMSLASGGVLAGGRR